jgi:hypothetical protein
LDGLGISMSLTSWSLVVFASYFLFYASMFVAVTYKATITKIAAMICFWIIHQVAILWYGIATNQIGFILIFVFQFIITLLTIVVNAERNMSENN